MVDRAARRIRVIGTRTDGDDVRSYALTDRVQTVAATKESILKTLQDKHTEAVALETQDAATLRKWEAALADAMNAWEYEQ